MEGPVQVRTYNASGATPYILSFEISPQKIIIRVGDHSCGFSGGGGGTEGMSPTPN